MIHFGNVEFSLDFQQFLFGFEWHSFIISKDVLLQGWNLHFGCLRVGRYYNLEFLKNVK
jgi:hypothetical protein